MAAESTDIGVTSLERCFGRGFGFGFFGSSDR